MTATTRVKKITNRLLESTTKLDKYAREGITTINSDAVSQAGLYIRPGSLSPKTGKLGAHSIYCRLKTGRKIRIAKLADIVTRDAGPDQITLAEVEAICRKWREQGFADEVSPTTIPENESNVPTFDECFDHWIDIDARGSAREKSESYKSEARRKWRSQTPDAWKTLPLDVITTRDVVSHAEMLKRKQWVSQATGKKIGGRWSAYEWLVMMQSMFNGSRLLHEIAVNPFELVLDSMAKPTANGHRALTGDEIAAVLNIGYDQVGDPHLWMRVLAVKVGLLTGLRRGGLVSLKVAEINGVAIERDVADKTYNAHKLPIPTQLREILDEILALKNGEHPLVADDPCWARTIVPSEYLFPKTTGASYMHRPNDLCKGALDLIRKEYGLEKARGGNQTSDNHFTLHCLRYTVETIARDMGLDPDPILNHAKPKRIGDTYFDPTDKMKQRAFERMAEDHQALVDALFEIASHELCASHTCEGMTAAAQRET